MSQSKATPRCWLSFRLRTLLAALTVVAVACTFAGREYREWKRRERARQQRAQLLDMLDSPVRPSATLER